MAIRSKQIWARREEVDKVSDVVSDTFPWTVLLKQSSVKDDSLCIFFFFCLALPWRGMWESSPSEIWEGNWDVLGGWISQWGRESQLHSICIHQAHLHPIPISFNCKCTLSSSGACLTSSKSVPHRARWVTWNKTDIPTCRKETKGGCREQSMTPASTGMCHEPPEENGQPGRGRALTHWEHTF